MKTTQYLILIQFIILGLVYSNCQGRKLSETLSLSECSDSFVKVGTIRWDAWVGERWSAGLEVERILSGIPQSNPDAAAVTDYHFRVPWFGTILPDNKVLARYTDLQTVEREIRYAKAAGIDYWATVWYGDHNSTTGSLHRNLWTKSLQRNSLQWCHVFDGNFRGAVGDWTTPKQKKLVSDIVAIDFKSDAYVKTNTGRPVFYIHDAQENWNVCVNMLYTECALQGVPEPFVIIGTFQTNTDNINHIVDACRASGISSYVVAGKDNITYASNAEMERSRWSLWNSCNGVAIPTVTAGWDNRPRYYCGCPWYANIEDLRNSWIQYPTPVELQKQVVDAIEFTQANSKATDFKSVLIYAWNEYDEGGFIAPTLFELQDKANNYRPVKLDAINRAIQSFRVTYSDIEGHMASNEIRQLASSHVFSGISNDKFCPDQIINVNEYTAWLVRTFGLYADVSNVSIDIRDSFARDITIAKALGILNGQDEHRQGMAFPITDKEVISLTANVMELLKISESDADAHRIFNSIPGSRMTRAKATVMLSRCLELPFKHYQGQTN